VNNGPRSGRGALYADSLSKSFGGVRALNDVSIRCDMSEIVGLIGPNGAGKTTLLNVMTGVHLPERGTVNLSGFLITGRHPHEIARLGLARTFQNIRLFRRLSVADNVLAALAVGRKYRSASEDADRLLAEVGLSPYAMRFAGTLSYGHQRRLEIARALALRPDFLLLDEPAAGASNKESRELANVVVAVKSSRGCGIVVIDHDIRFVMSVSERLYVLNEGEVIAEGTADEVQTNARVAEVYLGSMAADGGDS
jgi:ABC-type branched-subunit amino acid transport system ATPase component